MIKKFLKFIYKRIRLWFYDFLSDKKIICKKNQPVLCVGIGEVKISESVILGVVQSPHFYSNYIYIEARNESSYIEIGEGCVISNSARIISDGCRIVLGPNCLFGTNLEILDSNFHGLQKDQRRGLVAVEKSDVTIGENVFVGNNVTILKGASIGKNSVIANGSIVTGAIPENVVAGGSPCRMIREL